MRGEGRCVWPHLERCAADDLETPIQEKERANRLIALGTRQPHVRKRGQRGRRFLRRTIVSMMSARRIRCAAYKGTREGFFGVYCWFVLFSVVREVVSVGQ